MLLIPAQPLAQGHDKMPQWHVVIVKFQKAARHIFCRFTGR